MKLHKAVKKMVNGDRIRRVDWSEEHYLDYSDTRIWFNCDSGTSISYEFGVDDFYVDWEIIE